MSDEKVVKVGLGLYILNEKHQILLGLRKSAHGNGTWCPPGGHMEYGESFEAAGVRETREETGLEIEPKRLEIAGVTNDFFAESGIQASSQAEHGGKQRHAEHIAPNFRQSQRGFQIAGAPLSHGIFRSAA